MRVHRLGVAPWQDQSGGLALLWADGAEDIRRRRPLVVRRRRPCASLGPTTGDLVFLADASFVAEPDLYVVAFDVLLARDLVQVRGEIF